jgi:hypothetical protein
MHKIKSPSPTQSHKQTFNNSHTHAHTKIITNIVIDTNIENNHWKTTFHTKLFCTQWELMYKNYEKKLN